MVVMEGTTKRTARITRIIGQALKQLQERPQHFQLIAGGMRTIRALERRGLARLGADLYVYPTVVS